MNAPQIVTKNAFTVIGLKYSGKNENQEIPQLWGKFLPRFGEIKNMIKSQVSFGVMGCMDPETGEFDYLACYEYDGIGEPPAGMETWEIHEQLYAVFPSTLPTLMDTFKEINDNWLPESGFQRSDGTEFELYDETFNPQDGNSILYLYIPVIQSPGH